MKKYEFIFLVEPGLTQKKQEKLFADLSKQLEHSGAKIGKKENLGIKSLVYQIDKQTEADFLVWHLSYADQPKFKPVSTFLSREPEIIRYLFLTDTGKGGK